MTIRTIEDNFDY